MADTTSRYWIVNCKTPECGILLLHKIGPAESYRFPFLVECRDFTVKCSGCLEEHQYSRQDVSWRDGPDQEFQSSPEFVAATHTLPPSDES